MQVKFEIFGVVQGVGFRPFIYTIATELGVFGEVYNDSEGVKIIAQADEKIIEKFKAEIYAKLPPLARIDKLNEYEISVKNYENFTITVSQITQKFNPLLPDFAICDDCKAEFYDSKNRRFHYAFINCTNCGPRLSVIKALPYDRANTTMAKFRLCDECESEYTNPLNRRFHAEPTSCENCGPTLFLKNTNGEILAQNENAIKLTAKELKNGKIVAIKGLGGFHLVCDGTNSNAIQTLRERKHRPLKPFAIMCKDEKMAEIYAEISPNESKILNSNIKPIVLLKNKFILPRSLAPSTDKIGIFIAPTGLYLLLFEYFNSPVVATSANISGEPIIFDEKALLDKMGLVIDFYLDNDRDIVTPSDDSLCYIAQGVAVYLRTSRGMKPSIYASKYSQKRTILALGAEMKNAFAIYKNGQIFISPYIGDIKNPATFERFMALLGAYEKNYDLKFDEIIGDLHPHFLHNKFFETKGFKLRKIQHHYAHLLSVLSEKNLPNAKYLGFAFDGTGYGGANEIWGGEIMLFDRAKFDRIFHFDEFRFIGGQNAIKNITLLAFSVLKRYGLNTTSLGLGEIKEQNLDKIYAKTSLRTSSLGRIFDAFACVSLGLKSVSFDGETGMMIESFYDANIDESYDFEIIGDSISYKNAFLGALIDEKSLACSRFINGIAKLIAKISAKFDYEIVFGGGVFANQTLMKKSLSELEKLGKKAYFNEINPINDSAIALGQLEFALNNKI